MVDWYPTSTKIEDVILWHEHLPSPVRGYWTGYHDQDTKVDGSPAEPHFHGVYWLKDTKTEKEWATWLIKNECPMVYPVNENGIKRFAIWDDVRAAVRYLEHLDEDECKHRYDSLAPYEGLSMDDAKHWLRTPLTASHSGSRRHDFESDRDSRSIMDVLDVIHEKDIGTMTELLCYCREDWLLIHCIRKNPYLIKQLLGELYDTTAKYTK